MATMTPSQSPPHEGEKKAQKILIIGAKGMLGRELVEEFRLGNQVIGWDRGEIDITRIADRRSQIADLKPDLVINAAAYNNVDKAESEPDLANAVNGYAVGYLASICQELDIPLVHYSTDYVFDGTNKEGYIEEDRPNPMSAYGASKYLGERELQKNSDKFYLIRLSRLFGKNSSQPLLTPSLNPSPQVGEGRVGGKRGGEGEFPRKKSFVKLILDLAKTRKELEVIDEELSCPTYASDLARQTRFILENNIHYGTYHSPNSGSCTWFGFACEIFKIAKIDVKLIPVPASRFPRPAKRPPYSVLLNTKLPPMRPWQEALREFLVGVRN